MTTIDRYFCNPADALNVSCREYRVRVHGPGSVPVSVWVFAPRGVEACLRALEWTQANWFRDARELKAEVEQIA